MLNALASRRSEALSCNRRNFVHHSPIERAKPKPANFLSGRPIKGRKGLVDR
jgi:hypothetical protein